MGLEITLMLFAVIYGFFRVVRSATLGIVKFYYTYCSGLCNFFFSEIIVAGIPQIAPFTGRSVLFEQINSCFFGIIFANTK